VGHRWGLRALVARQSEGMEQALWLAIRSLEERGQVLTKMAVAADERGRTISAGRFWHAAGEAKRSADVIRESVTAMTAEIPAGSEESG
jgi:two-component system chemotaxis response regulator CheB